jgi:hypothetical protein
MSKKYVIVGDNGHAHNISSSNIHIRCQRYVKLPHSQFSSLLPILPGKFLLCIYVIPHFCTRNTQLLVRHTPCLTSIKIATPVTQPTALSTCQVFLCHFSHPFCTRNCVIAWHHFCLTSNTLPQLPSLQYYRRSSRFLLY